MDYGITDLKKGVLISVDDRPYQVLESSHSAMGRGGGVVKTKLKNLHDGSTLNRTFKGSDKVVAIEADTISAQYLYSDSESAYFLRLDDYEQVALSLELIGGKSSYLKESLEVDLLYIDSKLVGIELPIKVEYRVIEADPNVKGDSAGNVLKRCSLETGLKVQVPLFIKEGDNLLVDTRNGNYIERV